MGVVACAAIFWLSVHNPAIGDLALFIMINVTHLRIKPLTLASGHSRYIAAAVHPNGRTLMSVGEWPSHIAAINM
jgi:hypothetical protein